LTACEPTFQLVFQPRDDAYDETRIALGRRGRGLTGKNFEPAFHSKHTESTLGSGLKMFGKNPEPKRPEQATFPCVGVGRNQANNTSGL